MPTDYYLEELPDGGAFLPTDIMHVQRNVHGTWYDYQFQQGNVNAVPVYVHEGTYTEVDLSGQEIELFTPPAGTVAVFLPMAFVRLDIPSPVGAGQVMQIGAPADQLSINFNNANAVERLAVTSAGPTILTSGTTEIEVSTAIASSSFTLYVRAPYVLIDI